MDTTGNEVKTTEMNTAARKAKGRRLQKMVCKDLVELGKRTFPRLEMDDVKSTPMGCSGVDCQFSPQAKKLFGLAVECKNRESLNVHAAFVAHCEGHSRDTGKKILVHSRNRSEPLVTMKWVDFLEYVALDLERKNW